MSNPHSHLLLGAHESIADGFHSACVRGEEDSCEVIQIFTRSSRQWSAPKLNPEDVSEWENAVARSTARPFLVHDSYLINLGSPKKRIHAASMRAFKDELVRAEALSIPNLVMHPGAHMGEGEEVALERIAESITKAIQETSGHRVRILLENTAGQGSTVGYRFEHLRRILDLVNNEDRMGVCLDTCHLFTSGYDIRTSEGYHRVFQEFERIVGLKWLKAFHLNDSKKPLDSRVDRHEHIGLGHIGLDPFRWLMNDERFAHLGGVLETPVRENRRTFKEDLEVLRGLRINPKSA
ncbi:MAG: deoxyribonuclease IV [Nitrospirae bacterium]|nr:deoxyribonuclease IV [Nitrospirota bacterium]